MNNDITQGKWSQLHGKLKRQWGKFTDDDLSQMDGQREYLVGKVQERYGIAKDVADAQVAEFEQSLR